MSLDPEFTHDCDMCIYLGTIKRVETILVTPQVSSALTRDIEKPSMADLARVTEQLPLEIYDLYVCLNGSPLGGASIIARHGHEGPDYKSAPAWYAPGPDRELTLGFEYARAAGLIPKLKPKKT